MSIQTGTDYFSFTVLSCRKKEMSKCARGELWTPLGVATEALAQVLCALRFALLAGAGLCGVTLPGSTQCDHALL